MSLRIVTPSGRSSAFHATGRGCAVGARCDTSMPAGEHQRAAASVEERLQPLELVRRQAVGRARQHQRHDVGARLGGVAQVDVAHVVGAAELLLHRR